MKKGAVAFWGVLLALVVLGLGAAFYLPTRPGQLDSFAQCLKDKGALMYGAFWCPHCAATKRMFGGSAKYLPYVECSTSDGRGQLPVCKDQGITSYPTWVFPGGERLTGERTLAELSQASGCPVRQ